MRVLRFLRDTAIDLCLGCRHDRLTRLFTIEEESYMVCLDCGKQLFYSIETMSRLSGRDLRRLRAEREGLRVVADAAGPVPAPVSAVAASQEHDSHLAA